MKKAKRLLALCVGLMMVLGCVSVSASDALTVTEKPAKMIYGNDFSGSSVDESHIVVGSNSTVLSDGMLMASPVPTGTFATVYAAKEGVTKPVTFEFDITNNGLIHYTSPFVRICPFGADSSSVIGDIRWLGGGTSTLRIVKKSGSGSHIDTAGLPSSSNIKITLNPLNSLFSVCVNGTEVLSEANSANYIASTGSNFKRVGGFFISMNNDAISKLTLDNLKIYTEESKSVPAVWEDIYKQDFEKDVDTFTATSNEIVPEINSNVTYTQKNGVLTMKTTNEGAGTKVYLQPSKEALDGKYVVEMVLKNCSQTRIDKSYHRITLGDIGTYYIQWYPNADEKNRTLRFRYSTAGTYRTCDIVDYNANGDTLKVTMCFDAEAYKLAFYFNDIFAFEEDYSGDSIKERRTSIAYINFNLYYGQIDLADLRVYRPLETDSNTGLKIEEKDNTVKIATASAKNGNLYFARYNGEGDNKSLASLGIAPLNLAPGKIYTVDKTNWKGARAFFWDNNLTPIVDPWNLAE